MANYGIFSAKVREFLLSRTLKREAETQNELMNDIPFEPRGATIKKDSSLVLQAKEESADRHAVITIYEPGKTGADGTLTEVPREEESPARPRELDVLEKFTFTRTADALIPFVDDKDPEVRRAAIAGLGEIGDPRAIETLKEALKYADWEERRIIAKALSDLGWEYERNETGFLYCIAVGDWEKCGEIGRFVLGPAISILKSSPDEESRENAALVLGLIKDYRAVDPLVDCLGNDTPRMRKVAAAALGSLGRRRAVEPLIAALENSDEGVSEAAREAIIRIGEGAIEPLVGGLKDHDENRRRNAIRVLDMMGDIAELQPFLCRVLISDLKDGDKWARIRTASALGDIRKEWAVKPLIEALYYYGVRDAARSALVKIGETGMDSLVAALRHRHISVRKAVAEILGEIGDSRSIKPLEAALKDKDWCVREAAQASLDSLKARGIETDSVVCPYPLTPPGRADSTSATSA